MDLVRTSIRQPVTITVGVLLVLLSGYLAIQRIPIQLTPNVEDTIVAVTTRWEGASPQEVEQDVVDPQEEKLQGITGLKRITSISQQGQGSIRLEFDVGTPKELALREVSDKLREVPSYPVDVDEPVVEASDPQNRDYIAWIVFSCSDPQVDVRHLQDFAEDRIKPVLERVPGISEINVLGGRERETQVRFDSRVLAQLGIGIDQIAAALRATNENVSAGALDEESADVRVRMVSQYETVRQIEDTLVAETAGGPVYVRDLAEVEETFKEPTGFVRSRGHPVIAINAQREVGSNVMQVMDGLQAAIERVRAPGGVLESLGRQMGIDGEFELEQVYDQTIYIDDALALVRNNIWIGGTLAILVLLLFLGSIRSAAIIALSIPISVVGAVVFLVALGRSVNVISLAGMAFAVGMVVDNAIVVLENVFRHLEMGKTRARAAYDGAREVFGAVVASTLTTAVVFVPILLIEEEAGQLFRDIALAIVAAVTLSLIVSVSVIPAAAARLLKEVEPGRERRGLAYRLGAPLRRFPDVVGRFVHLLMGSVVARVLVVLVLTTVSLVGTYLLLPPSDYLPTGNRNLVFGLVIPPPGMSVVQQERMGLRIEDAMRPYFEAGREQRGTEAYARAAAELPEVPTFDFATMQPGPNVTPPPLENYFLVSFQGGMFHGGIAAEPDKVADVMPLFSHATSGDVIPGIMAFAFQVPLFQLGGRSGSAVEINFYGDDLEQVTRAAKASYLTMVQRHGPFGLQPDPSNFDLPTPELQVLPDLKRLGEVGMTPAQLGLAVQALGDGALLGDYLMGSQTVDLKLVAQSSFEDAPLAVLGDVPIAAPGGRVVPLSALGELRRVNAPGQINRTGRQRSVTLQFTPPPGTPLGEALSGVEEVLNEGRASGAIPFDVQTSYTGSASKLEAVQRALLGDGSFVGTLSSSLVLALLVVYLLMCVLFQSFVRPLIIMFSVPLATLGGFAALYGIHEWSSRDRYMPVQNLDVLTMLGFVILIGIVVNNAILIVHQSIHFMKGTGDEGPEGEPMAPREAIAAAVTSRVRPIFMSTMTSVLGMSPLIFMPGAGSELYRGLGSVVVGGLLVSTVFTLLLVPMLLSLVSDLQKRLGMLPEDRAEGLDVDAPRARAALGLGTTVAVFLAAFLVAGSCGGRPAERRVPLSALAADVLRAELDVAAAPQPQQPKQPEPEGAPVEETSRVLELVGERLDELEALGGPASYREPTFALVKGEAEPVEPIALADAVDRAVAHNLGLRRTRLQTEIDVHGVELERGVFDPVLFSTLEGESSETPNRVPVLGGTPLGAPESVQDRALAELGVSKLLSSGATVSFSTFLERLNDRTDGIDFSPDPAWRSGVTAGVSQPLLRGRGSAITEAGIELARIASARSQEDEGAVLADVAALTAQAWWDLAEAWHALDVRRHLAAEGEVVERVLRERLDFDASQASYSDALASLQRRRADLVRAERTVRAASDGLQLLIGERAYAVQRAGVLAPAEEPPFEPALLPELSEALLTAFERRPELRRALAEIDDAAVRERLAADLKRPRLDLVARVSLAGLDDAAGESYDALASDDELTALLGLSFEHPIGARSARSAERQALLRSRRAVLAYEEALRDVAADVKDALRNLRTNEDLLDAARATRLAETENLRTILVEEEARERLTPEFLALKLSRQERLAGAQVAEIEARAGYGRALAQYRRAVGEPVDGP